MEKYKLKKNSEKRKAFTLVELLVVVAFISIMTSVAVVSFGNSKDRKIVEVEARKVAATIRETQNYALTGKNAGTACPTGDNNYIFTSTVGSSNYNVSGCIAASYTLQNGAEFSFGGIITFTAPFGTASPASTITVRKGSYCSDITVNTAGNVTEGPINSSGC